MVCSSAVRSVRANESSNGSQAVSKECVLAHADINNGSFNVEMAIASILADPNSSSLALPCMMSAEQRKHAKTLVAQYPNLKSESFGMGKDRQMHVFKCKSGENSARSNLVADCSPVNVKNTFIDDWIDADIARADNRIVQSMPHNMFAQCLSAELAGDDAVETEMNHVTSSSMVTKEAGSRWAEEPVLEEQVFDLGTQVMIEGLVKAPSFNGAIGVVQSWDAETGRYNVYLASATSTGHRWAKLKAENLQLAR